MDLPVSCPSLARRAFPYPVDGLVFDMDGILLDTEPLYRAAFTEAAAALGFAVGEDFYSSLVGLSTRERGALVQAHFGGDFPLEPFLAHYYERKRAACTPGDSVEARSDGAAALPAGTRAAVGARDLRDGEHDLRQSAPLRLAGTVRRGGHPR